MGPRQTSVRRAQIVVARGPLGEVVNHKIAAGLGGDLLGGDQEGSEARYQSAIKQHGGQQLCWDFVDELDGNWTKTVTRWIIIYILGRMNRNAALGSGLNNFSS